MFWFIFWLIFFTVIGLAIFFFVKYKTDKTYEEFYAKESPLDILKNRLAKGEITEEEFERIRKDL